MKDLDEAQLGGAVTWAPLGDIAQVALYLVFRET